MNYHLKKYDFNARSYPACHVIIEGDQLTETLSNVNCVGCLAAHMEEQDKRIEALEYRMNLVEPIWEET